MRKLMIASVAAAAFAGLAACQSPVDDAAETQADALEAQAAATPNDAQADALDAQADRIEQEGGNADGGMTTGNTPTTPGTEGSATAPMAPTDGAMAPAPTPPAN